MNEILRYFLIGYSVVTSVLLLSALVTLFFKKKVLSKNKCKYDLRNVRFIVEPIGDENYILNFHYGEKVLHSKKFTDSDLFVDQSLPYKEFVKWCEENGE